MRCYLLAAAVGSSVDSRTNNFTLFSLVEQVTLGEYPADLPIEIHAYFELEPAEINTEIYIRVVLLSEIDVPRQEFEPLRLMTNSVRIRVCVAGLKIPEPGKYYLGVEARSGNTAPWNRFEARWPLVATLSPPTNPLFA